MPQSVRTGWSDHHTRTVALDGWLAREEAVAAGTVAALDPVLLGLPDRETLLRSLFQRFATTLEGALDVELDLGADPAQALRTAYRKAVRHRPADWRALQREAADPVVADLSARQHGRIARRAGLGRPEVAAIAGEQAPVTAAPQRLATRARRRRVAPRVLARWAG